MNENSRLQAEDELRKKLVECRIASQNYQREFGNPLFLLDRRAARLKSGEYSGCRVFSDREAMMQAMGKGAVGVEVGVAYGGFSRFILNNCEMDTLHLIDREFARLLPEVESDDRTILHEGDSAEMVSGLADALADWIYIDADHRYDGCRADAQAAKGKLKPGGLLFFNDYSVWAPMNFLAWGVPAVVHEFLEEGWILRGMTLGDHFGSHDVVLSAPGTA